MSAATVLHVPAGHGDAVGTVDPAAHRNPAAHGPEQLAVVRPATEPYLPRGHNPEHRAVGNPHAPPYVPIGHGVQVS